MPSMSRFWSRKAAYVLCAALLLGSVARAQNAPKPLPKEEQAKVDKAIDRAVDYLKRKQRKEGDWPRRWRDKYVVGECALPAYALLEAGVAPDDPVIQKAANFIRPKALKTDQTYELSLAVLFFDRLGDPRDKKLIQRLALRLIAGQYRTGGWAYHSLYLTEAQEKELPPLLEQLSKHLREGKSKKEALRELKKIGVSPGLRVLTVFKVPEELEWDEHLDRSKRLTSREAQVPGSIRLAGITDNSNTQFAMLALWVAQRYGIPTEPTFGLVVERFERSQLSEGRWEYGFDGPKDSLPSMICVGLLGLSIGQGLKLPAPGSSRPGQDDPRILAGLAALYAKVGVPAGQMNMPVSTQDVYFLWSLERVGMLFDLPILGDKEWYRWGAESLVMNQYKTGEWPEDTARETKEGRVPGWRNFYGTVLNTAFALLFLKRSHPMKDLTPKLPITGKKLNLGITRALGGKISPELSTTSPSRGREP